MDKIEFNKIISGIWKKIFKDTFVPIKEPKKDEFLNNLFDEIQNYSYTASNPREYIVLNKHNLVSRIVPILAVKDICIYYYCIQKLDEKISGNRVESTFGGFSMGGNLRKKEDEEINNLNEVPFSVSPYTYNPLAWVNAWRDFQKKAFTYSSQDDYSYFIKFDIANFYDCINLNILENKIRGVCDNNHFDTIDLLFSFLKNWNRKFHKYSIKTVGIPQDEVGDCSRILANFYLQDFDQVFCNYCNKLNIKYLRYADDMILMGKDELETKRALFEASKELNKIGLNINSSKVDIFESKKAFDYYWAFDIFDKLGDKDNIKDIEEAIKMYKKCIKGNKKFRNDSVSSRLLNCDLNKVDISFKYELLLGFMDENYLINCKDWVILRIYNILSNEERTKLKEKLELLIDKVYFNQFHYTLLKCNNFLKFDSETIEKINKRIKEIAF
jgi:Reverse transcriptase (RNA-dependent DNA polymerase)